MSNPTDTNQASEDEMRKRLEKAGLYDLLTSIHESHEEDDCFCTTEIAPYYRQLLELIRTEKLKLLAEVRERVVGENVPHFDEKCEPDGGCVCYAGGLQVFQAEQLAELDKLEAEL